jgi:hypothetical protein
MSKYQHIKKVSSLNIYIYIQLILILFIAWDTNNQAGKNDITCKEKKKENKSITWYKKRNNDIKECPWISIIEYFLSTSFDISSR